MKKKMLSVLMMFVMCLEIAVVPACAQDGARVIGTQNGQMMGNDVDAAFELGKAYFNIGDMNGAISQLSMVSAESAQYVQAQSMLIQAKAQLRDQQLTIVDIYLSAGDYDTAINKIKEAYMFMPGDTVIMAKYEEILAMQTEQKVNNKKNTLEQAEEELQQNDFVSAIQILEEALQQMPNDAELYAAYIKTAMQYKNDFIQKIDELLTEKKYTEAETLITRALQFFPADEDIMNREYRFRVAETMEHATQMEACGNLAGAIVYLNSAGEDIQQQLEMKELMNRMIPAYRQQVIREAEIAYQTEGYLSAAQVIRTGQGVLVGDSQLHEVWTMYKDMAPVDMLNVFEKFASKDAWIASGVKDNVGNRYEKYIDGGRMSAETSISFKLDRKYSTLKGTAFLQENCKNTKYANWIMVYGDGMLLYEGSKITSQSMPEDFEINVKGVDVLKIDIKKDEYFAIWSVLGIGNMQLTK